MTKSVPRFPNSEMAKQVIESFNDLAWPEYTEDKNVDEFIKEFEKRYFKDLEALPNIIKIKKPSEFLLPFFRVREFDSIKFKDLVSEYSYPPSHITAIGRCNFPKRPVFYCSNNPLISLLETIKDSDFQDKIYCISKWGINPSEQDLVFEHFLRSDLHPDNPFKILVDVEKKQLKENFGDVWNDDIEKGFELIQEFLHNTFINDEKYGLSATLAHRTLFAPHNFATDILIYPSVQSKYYGVNMAISPNFVDQQMHVQRFYLVKVSQIDLDKEEFKFTFVKYGDMDKNKIIWRNISPDDLKYRDYLLEDFKDYLGDDFDFVFNERKEEI